MGSFETRSRIGDAFDKPEMLVWVSMSRLCIYQLMQQHAICNKTHIQIQTH